MQNISVISIIGSVAFGPQKSSSIFRSFFMMKENANMVLK